MCSLGPCSSPTREGYVPFLIRPVQFARGQARAGVQKRCFGGYCSEAREKRQVQGKVTVQARRPQATRSASGSPPAPPHGACAQHMVCRHASGPSLRRRRLCLPDAGGRPHPPMPAGRAEGPAPLQGCPRDAHSHGSGRGSGTMSTPGINQLPRTSPMPRPSAAPATT